MQTAWYLSALLAAAATAAGSAPPPDAWGGRQPIAIKVCAAEIKTVCGAVVPGQGRVQRCLVDHVSALGPNCRAEIRFEMRAAERRRRSEDRASPGNRLDPTD